MKKVIMAFAGVCATTLVGCGEKPVSFSKDVQPILNEHCITCHQPDGKGYKKSGLAMTSHGELMKGTRHGAVVKPGDSFTSALVMLIEGRADPSIKMPHGEGEPLGPARIATVKAWIDQGAREN